jgi:hypothetical protein
MQIIDNQKYHKIKVLDNKNWILTEFRHIKKDDIFKLYDNQCNCLTLFNQNFFIARADSYPKFKRIKNVTHIYHQIEI